jgi:cytochrome b6-f complex iron-sulfur subunit
MAEDKKMSVAEILAAARNADSKNAAAQPAESAPSNAPSSESDSAPAAAAPAESKPAAAKPAPAKSAAGESAAGGARLSVAEMMAAARAEKKDGGKPAAAPAAKATPAAKPAAAKPAAAKASPKAAPAESASNGPKETGSNGPKDTGSILAAARATAKPGPMSKAEAARMAPAAKTSPKPEKPRITVPPMPAKPDYAKPKSPTEPESAGRRDFMFGVLLGSLFGAGWTSLSVTFGLWGLGTARFMFPNVLTEPPSKFKVGFPSDFAPGQVETKFKAQYGVWVVNYEYNGQAEIYALRSVCTHLGCTPNWLEGEQKFKCPCHGSGFYKDGINFEGPAPRPLERYSIRIADDGQLEIDKSKLFQEEIGQWSDPASYVVV